jgi:hypothetical protein
LSQPGTRARLFCLFFLNLMFCHFVFTHFLHFCTLALESNSISTGMSSYDRRHALYIVLVDLSFDYVKLPFTLVPLTRREST